MVSINLITAAPDKKTSPSTPTESVKTAKSDATIKPKTPNFHFKRNPFKPVKWSPEFKSTSSLPTNIKLPESKTLFSLTGIIWDEKKPYAILSFSGTRKIVSAGDMVEDIKIHSISRSELILKRATETFILTIGNDILL